MPRGIKRVVDNGPFNVNVSGTTFKAGVNKRFSVKPTGERKTGYGVTKKFTNLTRDQLRELADLMAELACDEADAGRESAKEAIYTDLKRFPKEAGL